MSITLPAHDKSLHLKPILSSRKWTIGDVMENRAEVNERREAGSEGWITEKIFLRLWVGKFKNLRTRFIR